MEERQLARRVHAVPDCSCQGTLTPAGSLGGCSFVRRHKGTGHASGDRHGGTGPGAQERWVAGGLVFPARTGRKGGKQLS